MRTIHNAHPQPRTLGNLLSGWRHDRLISQMDLALDAGISTRHLSFIETGKAQPSREVIMKLAQAMSLTFRQTNNLLLAADYAPEYKTLSLDSATMAHIRQAINRLLLAHEPYPAFVINHQYDLLSSNEAFRNLLSEFLSDTIITKYQNIYHMIFADDGLKPFIRNWQEIALFLHSQLEHEAHITQDESLIALLTAITKPELSQEKLPTELNANTDLPVLSIILNNGHSEYHCFSMTASFGTPLAMTVEELRIEYLFPSDHNTQQQFMKLTQ